MPKIFNYSYYTLKTIYFNRWFLSVITEYLYKFIVEVYFEYDREWNLHEI